MNINRKISMDMDVDMDMDMDMDINLNSYSNRSRKCKQHDVEHNNTQVPFFKFLFGEAEIAID